MSFPTRTFAWLAGIACLTSCQAADRTPPPEQASAPAATAQQEPEPGDASYAEPPGSERNEPWVLLNWESPPDVLTGWYGLFRSDSGLVLRAVSLTVVTEEDLCAGDRVSRLTISDEDRDPDRDRGLLFLIRNAGDTLTGLREGPVALASSFFIPVSSSSQQEDPVLFEPALRVPVGSSMTIETDSGGFRLVNAGETYMEAGSRYERPDLQLVSPTGLRQGFSSGTSRVGLYVLAFDLDRDGRPDMYTEYEESFVAVMAVYLSSVADPDSLFRRVGGGYAGSTC